MGREVELSSLDLRYENYRMKHPALESADPRSLAVRIDLDLGAGLLRHPT
jgi:hypothetical protein